MASRRALREQLQAQLTGVREPLGMHLRGAHHGGCMPARLQPHYLHRQPWAWITESPVSQQAESASRLTSSAHTQAHPDESHVDTARTTAVVCKPAWRNTCILFAECNVHNPSW